jgi:2'-5' RNA ligase
MGRIRRAPRPPLPRLAVAWFPRFRGIERLEEFRRRHDPVAHLIPAHLSLVFPFPTALTPMQVTVHVRRVVSRWPAIPVTFRTVRSEANEFVFLMAARGAASIVALHDKLYTRSLRQHLRAEFPYAPHITLGRHADFAALELAVEEARELVREEIDDVIRAVTLLSVERDGRIAALESIALNSA